MGKIKSLFEYLGGVDILRRRKKWDSVIKNTRPLERIEDKVDDIISFGVRYVPTVMEVDAIRRLFDGQYGLGSVELIFAEYIRISDYYSTKRKQLLLDSLLNLQKKRREMNIMDRRFQEEKARTERLNDKIEGID